VGFEELDLLTLAVFENLKIRLSQVGDRFAVFGHDNIDHDQTTLGVEDGRRFASRSLR
jgi:hypothetical protein